jgi:hypothetical protein
MQVCWNAFCCPYDTQSMQHELISRTQLTGVYDGLKCVINITALCDTPGFVTNDSVTVDTGCIRAVLIAVAQWKGVLFRHK